MNTSTVSAAAPPPFTRPALQTGGVQNLRRRAGDRAPASTWLTRVGRELWQVRQTWRTLRSMQTLQAQQAQQHQDAGPARAPIQMPMPPTHPAPPVPPALYRRHAGVAPRRAAQPPARPTLALRGVNFLVFQTAWFAAVLGAAQHTPLWGTATVLAAIGWHLAASARPAQEARLVAAAALIGFCVETAVALQGHVVYPSGQPIELLAPYWMVALWGLLAITLNVTMRWLKGRHALAALLGAIAGPASFYSGAQLGGVRIIDMLPVLLTLAAGWAVLMPLLMMLSVRFDGVVVGRGDAADTEPANA